MSKNRLSKQVYEGVVFFPHLITFRLRNNERIQVHNILKTVSKYNNLSHFIRCAIINQIKKDIEEIGWQKLQQVKKKKLRI